MTSAEKETWIQALVSVVTYSAYLIIILSRAAVTPITQVDYFVTMLWTIGISIVSAIVLNIIASIVSGDGGKKDRRDREIFRYGEFIGHGWLIAGALGSIFMAAFEVDYFWIANALYLAFTLSAITSCTARIVAYRGGFQQW